MRAPRPYGNPYATGAALGLVLLGAFLVMGHGIGASGALAATVAAGEQAVAPAHVEATRYFAPWTANGGHPLTSWIVFEVLGVFAGGALSAALAGRLRFGIERGPRAAARGRLLLGFGGGLLMGFASRLARGCTSGQALTGGALLSVGSWVFMLAIFAGGYLFAPLFRREWT
jgi:uncharacterized membrane protein YedE/YeeE